ncbi:DUF6879 family protein [Actinocorallia sp. A-T 12471]|uniref:DUF6879 family protein n=1 Tax=Actinocorallia sp. A-T 12471 TaxID=3089813 RepID=UPI0029D1AA1A|nr:DUF6879 family protein [Actinocorallia sp. A-T 12471]MDX6741751.1 hypothetical protein [Actinocorallia sp. A-T 12471]
MSSGIVPPDDDFFPGLFRRTRSSAVHLEMRDGYMADADFDRWLAEGRPASVDPVPGDEGWMSTVAEAVRRGVEVRRARIVSTDPVSDYTAWLHAVTARFNVAAGEQVRWLPRRRASMLCLPGNDFWVFDDTVVWNHFTGDGEWLGVEVTDDPAASAFCRKAFDGVWTVAVEHGEFCV